MHRAVLAVAVGCGLAAFAGWGRADAFVGERVDAQVPFAFNVAGTRLPAGEYKIQQVGFLDPHLMKIVSRDGRREAYFLTDDAAPTRSVRAPELVFDRYGRRRFLHAVLLPDNGGAVVEVSRTEIHAAEHLADANAKAAPPAARRP